MANVVINGGQFSTNLQNVILTVTSLTRPFIYASEVAAPTLAQIGSNWIDTAGVDPYVMNFVLSRLVGTAYSKVVYVQFADDASGTNYTTAETVSSSISLYANVRLPLITYPADGVELTNRSVLVKGTCEPGATVTVVVEAL